MKITTLEKIHYRPSDKAKEKIKKALAKARKTRPTQSINATVDELIIKAK